MMSWKVRSVMYTVMRWSRARSATSWAKPGSSSSGSIAQPSSRNLGETGSSLSVAIGVSRLLVLQSGSKKNSSCLEQVSSIFFSSPPHQIQWIDAQCVSDPLQALQRQVAFSSFDATHVGTVHTEDFSEGFLAETLRQTVGAQVRAYRPLQITNRHKAIASPCAT